MSSGEHTVVIDRAEYERYARAKDREISESLTESRVTLERASERLLRVCSKGRS